MKRNSHRPASRALQIGVLVGVCVIGLAHAQQPSDLLSKNGCTACHAQSSKLVSPSFDAIRDRYKSDADAESKLIASMRQGSQGHWGSVPMPPNARLSEADARRLAGWVLSGR